MKLTEKNCPSILGGRAERNVMKRSGGGRIFPKSVKKLDNFYRIKHF